MSAEIAILNKLAVVLATDSAVTVSSENKEHKTYDSADKLFDLSTQNPIGIMIYNGLQFMEAPLQVLIAEFRLSCKSYSTVRDAAEDFLKFLNEWGKNSPDAVVRNSLEALIKPAADKIKERTIKQQYDLVTSLTSVSDDFSERFQEIPFQVIAEFENSLSQNSLSKFVGGSAPEILPERTELIESIVEELWETTNTALIERLVSLSIKLITLNVPSLNQTGIVIAGFGTTDKFPSLISFTLDGVIFDKLKYSETNYVDIDRRGDKARVIPFAQQDMVERFLYGLDSDIEREITTWCADALPGISNQLIDSLVIDEPSDKSRLLEDARAGEQTFINDLKNKRFEEIRTSSRSAIEGMVEFMPKPEMARMAEALVNLTSLKRRVSRGMDTVGGPIDVAVISKTEGFIWVKRKHYFDAGLNPRYISRISSRRQPNLPLRRNKGEDD